MLRLFYHPTDVRKPSLIIDNVFHSPVPTLMPESSKIKELAWSFSEVRYAHHGVFHTLLRGLQVAGWLVARNYTFWKHPNKNHTKSLTDPGAVRNWCGVSGVDSWVSTCKLQARLAQLNKNLTNGRSPTEGSGLMKIKSFPKKTKGLRVSIHCLKNESHHAFILKCLINIPTSQRGSLRKKQHKHHESTGWVWHRFFQGKMEEVKQMANDQAVKLPETSGVSTR